MTYQQSEDFLFLDRAANLADETTKDLVKILNQQGLTRLQIAFSEISSPAFTQIFAIRELVKLSYLFPAEVLIRPLLERLATMSYLRKSGDEVLKAWESDWENGKKRPLLKDRLAMIDDLKNPFVEVNVAPSVPFKDFVIEFTSGLHSVVHGDRKSSYRSIAHDIEGNKYFSTGPNPYDQVGASRICVVGACAACYLVNEMRLVFSLKVNGEKFVT